MPRRREVPKRKIIPDPRYGDRLVAKFMNVIMESGKKAIAERIIYGALEQVEKKARGAEETMDYDEDYICALEHGLPPTAGFGMGIDRLTMALTAQKSIREFILFPLLRPER